jgi:hypothetical protein
VIRDLAHVNEYIVHLDRLGVVVRTVDRVPHLPAPASPRRDPGWRAASGVARRFDTPARPTITV